MTLNSIGPVANAVTLQRTAQNGVVSCTTPLVVVPGGRSPAMLFQRTLADGVTMILSPVNSRPYVAVPPTMTTCSEVANGAHIQSSASGKVPVLVMMVLTSRIALPSIQRET